MLNELAELTQNESSISLAVLKELLAYEHGDAMKVLIKRGDGKIIGKISSRHDTSTMSTSSLNLSLLSKT